MHTGLFCVYRIFCFFCPSLLLFSISTVSSVLYWPVDQAAGSGAMSDKELLELPMSQGKFEQIWGDL